MRKQVAVERDHVRSSIYLAAKRVLRKVLGKGDHEPLAGEIAEGVVADFDRVQWEVRCPERAMPTTPGSEPGRE